MTVRWNFVSAGNSCSGWPARVGELYAGGTETQYCCPQSGFPTSCVANGGVTPGIPNFCSCSGSCTTFDPNTYRPTIYKENAGTTVIHTPDWSASNGNMAGQSTYIPAGTDLNMLRAVTGFLNNQGASCPMPNGAAYCYGGSAQDLTFDPSQCDVWITTTYAWCAWSSASVSVKFTPVGGCPSPSPSPSASPSPSPVVCPYSVGSGIDCTAVTCGAGSKYYLWDVGSYSNYLSTVVGATAASPNTCRQNMPGQPLNATDVYVACGPTPPSAGGGYSTCSDNTDLGTYYQHSSYTLGCGSNIIACSSSPSPSPSPSPSVSPSPGTCDYSSGGAGRMCVTTADCCSGYSCEIAGAQQMYLYPGCTSDACVSKTRMEAGFANPSPSSTDYMLTIAAPPSGSGPQFYGGVSAGATKVCVPNPPAPPVPPASDRLRPSLYIEAGLAAAPTPDASALRWDTVNSKFQCYLQQNDLHRVGPPNAPEGCSCDSGYEPIVMSPGYYTTLTYRLNPNKKMDRMWAQILNLIEHNKEASLKAKSIYDKWVPDAHAYACAAPPSPQTCTEVVVDATRVRYLNCTDWFQPVSGLPFDTCFSTYSGSMCYTSGNGPGPVPANAVAYCNATQASSHGITAGYYQNILGDFDGDSTTDIEYRWIPGSPSPPPPGNMTFNPNTYNFGTVPPNTGSTPLAITITNNTTTSYTNCSVIVDDPTGNAWILNNTNNCTNLAGNASCTVQLIASPPDTAAYDTTLTITCGAVQCATNSKKQKFDFIVDLNKKAQKLAIKATEAAVGGIKSIDELFIGTAGACYVPACPATNWCDCIGMNWQNCGFASLQACYCAIGYNPSQNCGGPPPSGPSACVTSGVFAVNTTGSPTPTPTITPTPTAGAVKLVLNDYGAVPNAGAGLMTWNPWDSPGTYNYGVVSAAATPIANAVALAPAGTKVLGCMQQCPTTPASESSHRECWDETTGCDPKMCVCDNPAQTWDPVNRRCSLCKEGQYIDSGGNCTCPYRYSLKNIGGVEKCRPDLMGFLGPATVGGPTGLGVDDLNLTEFTRNAQGYPVCGTGRIPVRYDMQASTVSGTDTPRTASQTTDPLYPVPYPYTVPVPTASPTPGQPQVVPHYIYHDYIHCACMASGDTLTAIVGGNPQTASQTTASGAVRFAGDTLDVISRRGPDGKPSGVYGPVAIANDNGDAIDGRTAAAFSTSASKCGCPNVNEVMVPLDSSDPLSGYRCVSGLAASPADQMFYRFNPTVHTGPLLLDAASEQTSGGVIVDKIRLPETAASPNPSNNLYQRGIWLCQLGYTFGSGGTCTFNRADNMCDESSEVSGSVTGVDYATRFRNAINKKLNCCGFQFGSAPVSGASPVKFDCVANNTTNYANFDALWASSDDETNDGGQLNAIELADRSGRLLTGWYTLDGARCNELGSFPSTAVVRGRLNPMIVQQQQGKVAGGSGAFEATTGNIPVPTSGKWTQMLGYYASAGKTTRAPQPNLGTPAEIASALRCPVFIRAAAIFSCPDNAVNSPIRRTFTDAGGVNHCAAAASTQIHVHIEQPFEIMGTKSLKPIDTVLDTTQVKNITLKELWQVNGFGTCPKGSTQTGDTCTY